MRENGRKFSVFLTPAVDDYHYLDGLISDLAATHGGPSFQPHVTLYSGRMDDLDALTAAVAATAGETEPFAMGVAGIGCTEAFFRSVFITFHDHLGPFRINQLVRHRLREDSGYVLQPHLSLAYLDLPLAEKCRIGENLDLQLKEILFDEVRLVIPEDEERGWMATGAWEVAGAWRLGTATPDQNR